MSINPKSKKCGRFNHIELLCNEKILHCKNKQYYSELDKLSEIKYRYLENFVSCKYLINNKIPPILHLVWVFGKNSFYKDIKEKHIDLIKNNIQKLKEDGNKWQYYLWTNDVPLLQEKIKLDLEIKHIEEENSISTRLKNKIYHLIDNGDLAIASDTIRLLMLRIYGGVYMDINYVLKSPIYNIIQCYDFFSSTASGYEYVIEVTPIGAIPNHPIIIETVHLLMRNLFSVTAPDYVRFPCNKASETFAKSGTPLSLGYYKYANKKTIDIAFPEGVLSAISNKNKAYISNVEKKAIDYASVNLPQLGFDQKENSWIFKNYNQLIQYTCFGTPSIQVQLCERNIICDFKLLKQLRQKHLNKLPFSIDYSKESKIPAKLHFVWVTSEYSKKEVSSKNIKLIEQNIKILSKDGQQWHYYLWTNDESLIPKTVESLKNLGITIKNINELSSLSNQLQKNILELIDDHLFAIASDALRILILLDNGGVYIDVDYSFYTTIRKIMQSYDFFAKEIPIYTDALDVVPIGSSPNHPILKTALQYLEINLDKVSAPDYIKYPCSYKDQSYSNSAILSYGFYESGNKHSTTDIVFSYKIFHSKVLSYYYSEINSFSSEDLLLEKYDYICIPPIGHDNGDKSWYNEY